MNDREFERVFNALLAIPDAPSIICEGVSQAVDEVVDPVRSGRWTVGQLTQPEKTVIGIRVENILREKLELPRAAHLDVVIDGTNVDIKFTIGTNWMIPPEARGQLCLLTRFNVAAVTVSAGLMRADEKNLIAGRNRDRKSNVAASGRTAIRWIIQEQEPKKSIVGFLGSIDSETRKEVTDMTVGAQERLNRLFRRIQNRLIPEEVVQAVALGHKEWDRRLRADTRNRKSPENQGIEVLFGSSRVDRPRIKELDLDVPNGYYISVER